MAGRRDRRSQEEMVHPAVTLDHPEDDREMPIMAMMSFTTSWSRMTVLLMMAGDVYRLVTSGWMPN